MGRTSQAEIVARTDRPATRTSLTADLRQLGVETGMTMMVHSSLSRLGYVSGGPQAVVLALRDAVGESGTLMMPTHSAEWSDPARWQNPPVDESWWETLRAEMPAFDTALTPSQMMGSIVECFRSSPGILRSSHPTTSAAALGPNAELLVANHSLDDGLGEGSPQARLYELDGHVLLLGVDHGNNTSLHLSEYRSGLDLGSHDDASPIGVDGVRRWQTHRQLNTDEGDFPVLGESFAATGGESRGPVGIGTARLMGVQEVVDFGVDWLRSNRAVS